MKELEYRTSRLFRALGSPIRYQIIKALTKGRRRPADLKQLLKRSLKTTSSHLAVLRAADLVRYDWEKGTMWY